VPRGLPQAVRYFLRQDWPAKELVVVDDGAEPVRGLLPDLPWIRYVRLEGRAPLGTKRNRGCEAAQGDILVHWDDDDWMSARRLRLQVEALLRGKADLCGLDRLFYFEPSSGRAWEYVYPTRSRSWVAGGTFCYRREVWRRNRFAAVDVGEDTRFLWAGGGPRILVLPDNRFYVGLMHGGNTSTKHTSDPRWQPRPAELLHGVLGADLAFYGIAPAAGDGERDAVPLVSCIMPTRDRPGFVRQAIEYFLHQDHPHRELIVADDGVEPVERLLPADPRVRYLRLDAPLSLGEKRNLAIAASRGEIIAHWDDDDWYRHDYLSAVVAALLAGNDPRGLAGLGDYLVLLPGSSQLKVCRSRGVAGATFCYFRALWEEKRFRDVAAAEDYFFLSDAAPRLLPLKKPELFMVVRHGGNTWRRENGTDVEARLRRLPNYPQPLERVTGTEDALFYRTLDAAPPRQPTPQAARAAQVVIDREAPLVSCIMPTCNRRLYVPQAIRYFLRQDYPRKELVVVDDGSDPVGDLMPADERIRYLRLDRKVSIGEKRNRAVEASRGEIVVHFDDDDWHGAGRLTHQIQPLLRGEAEVCGLDTGWILNILDGRFWSCAANLHARMFYADIHGGSIGYKRDVWLRQARFPEINLAEDAAFLRRLSGRARIRKVLNSGVFVYVRHDENAWAFICGQLIDPSSWKQVDPPAFLAEDLDFYAGVLRELDGDSSRQKRLGDALRLGRRYREALERYERALAANPLDPWAWYDKGQTLEALGRLDEALAALLEADRLLHPQDGNRPWVHAQLGKLYRRLGSRDQARRQLETALRLDPRNPTARSELRGLRA
jgi:glycosyltransferase involved in cell wall biosynthesis